MITAILTARGNNTLKDKNLIKIFGKPLMFYPCNEAKKVKSINNFFVSSEDKKILKQGNAYGYKTILRPKKFALPNSNHHDVLLHAIDFLNKKKLNPEILVILLGNAPIIKKKWIEDSIKILKKNKKISSVVPVVQDNDHHPLRSKKIKNNFLKGFVKTKKKVSTNRQDLENCYFLCHNFWVIKTQEILKNKGEKPWSFLGSKSYPYIIDNHIDIHKIEDIQIARHILKKIG